MHRSRCIAKRGCRHRAAIRCMLVPASPHGVLPCVASLPLRQTSSGVARILEMLVRSCVFLVDSHSARARAAAALVWFGRLVDGRGSPAIEDHPDGPAGDVSGRSAGPGPMLSSRGVQRPWLRRQRRTAAGAVWVRYRVRTGRPGRRVRPTVCIHRCNRPVRIYRRQAHRCLRARGGSPRSWR